MYLIARILSFQSTGPHPFLRHVLPYNGTTLSTTFGQVPGPTETVFPLQYLCSSPACLTNPKVNALSPGGIYILPLQPRSHTTGRRPLEHPDWLKQRLSDGFPPTPPAALPYNGTTTFGAPIEWVTGVSSLTRLSSLTEWRHVNGVTSTRLRPLGWPSND